MGANTTDHAPALDETRAESSEHELRKRKREEENEPSADETGQVPLMDTGEGTAVNLSFSIQQGLSEDLSSLRANDRTARMFMEMQCDCPENAEHLAKLLKGERLSTEADWARLDCELRYASGKQVEMQLHQKHPDHIDVMEPSGANGTRRKISESRFAVDSRSRAKREKGMRTFYTGTNLDVSISNATVTAELKFSTNITSRQHDRQNFMWCVALSGRIHGQPMDDSTETNEFEYVARRLKQKPAARKKKAPEVRKKLDIRSADVSESDSDVDTGDEPFAKRIRRSTRKAAAACRESLPKLIGDDSTEDVQPVYYPPTPAAPTKAAGTRQPALGRQFSVPQRIDLPVTPRTSADDDLMRQPTSGGRNLCRVESIDMLFGEDRTAPADLDNDLQIDEIDFMDYMDKQQKSTLGAQTSISLGRCLSGDDLLDALTVERSNSSRLLLSRCVSSDWMLPIAPTTTVAVSAPEQQQNSTTLTQGSVALSPLLSA